MLKNSEGRMGYQNSEKIIEAKFMVKIDKLRGEMKSEIISGKADVDTAKTEVKHVQERVQ